MRAIEGRTTARRWGRFALKCGLLLTDPKLWSAVNDQLQEHAENVSDVVKRKYGDASERVDRARDALRGNSGWPTQTMSFLGGVGLGIGLGMLLAPGSGKETRGAIREKAAGFRDSVRRKVDDIAGSTRIRTSPTNTATGTGTEGD
jgi:uncharacterized protein YjbJ (UPF0337 family)